MKLRIWLRKKGICQRYVAHHVGISPEHLNRILSGRRRASVGLAKKLAAFTAGDLTFVDILFPDSDDEDSCVQTVEKAN